MQLTRFILSLTRFEIDTSILFTPTYGNGSYPKSTYITQELVKFLSEGK